MKPIHPKYKIKKGDSISSISALFGIEESIWLRYHNNMCRLSDIFTDELPKHLVDIFLLPELWDKADELNSKTHASLKKLLSTDQKNSYILKKKLSTPEKQYGCLYIFTEKDKERTVKYEVKVKYLENRNSNAFYELDRITPVYIDDKLPDLLMDNLSYEAGSIFYPLHIKINGDGNFVCVVNQEEIRNRWTTKKTTLSDYYKGEEVERYLSIMESVVNDESAINSIFETDLFITTYFASIYKSYTPTYETEKEIYYPLIRKIPLKFKVSETLKDSYTSYGTIELRHKGILTDDRTQDEIEQGCYYAVQKIMHPECNSAIGNYEGIYSLAAESMQIRSYVGKWDVELENKKTIELRIFQKEEDEI